MKEAGVGPFLKNLHQIKAEKVYRIYYKYIHVLVPKHSFTIYFLIILASYKTIDIYQH